jgi:hypothetical protein
LDDQQAERRDRRQRHLVGHRHPLGVAGDPVGGDGLARVDLLEVQVFAI